MSCFIYPANSQREPVEFFLDIFACDVIRPALLLLVGAFRASAEAKHHSLAHKTKTERNPNLIENYCARPAIAGSVALRRGSIQLQLKLRCLPAYSRMD